MQKLINYSYLIMMCLLILIAGCSKDNGDNSSSITINSAEQVYFEEGTTDNVHLISGEDNFNVVWSADRSVSVSGSYAANYNSSIFHDPISGTASPESFQVLLGSLNYVGSIPADTEFESVFATGSRTYTTNGIDGVELIYVDETNKAWSTAFGSGNQTGSSFEITNIDAYDLLADHVVKIRAEFNATLYNLSGGSKTITNGVVVLSFANI